MTAETKTAAERIRKAIYRGCGEWLEPDGNALDLDDMADLRHTLASAYLAEHPADDGELIDEAFVRPNTHTLPTNGDGPFWHWLESGKPYHTVHVFLRCSEFGRWSACVSMPAEADCTPWKEICELKTRGDVRRLCAALGIELKAA